MKKIWIFVGGFAAGALVVLALQGRYVPVTSASPLCLDRWTGEIHLGGPNFGKRNAP